MSTDTTSESVAADTENMNLAFDKLTMTSVDSTCDTLTLASLDSTSDTLTLASLDSTSDTLTLANVDSTSDTLTLASLDSTSDTLTLANVDSTSDTLTLARLDRENQGPWEFEYSYGGEANLHQHYSKCTKNPEHKKFIPIDKFSIEDLSDDYHDKDVFNLIRAVSELTVRLTVKKGSGNIPATVPSGHKLYPGTVVGTGYVYCVNVVENNPCECKECFNSSTSVMNYANIFVKTAAHLISEDNEEKHITSHLFFDRGNTPDTCSDVVTLTGGHVPNRIDAADICLIRHYTHDLNLARRLDQTLKRLHKLSVNWNLPLTTTFKQKPDDPNRQPLLVIVSHPHGCSKQVSLGRWTSAVMFNNVTVSYQYDTATCPGSSGASVCKFSPCDFPVFTNPRFHRVEFDSMSVLEDIHCGVSDKQLGLNYSRSEIENRPPPLVSLEMLQLDTGPWEDHFCCLMEDDETSKHYAACKKNPGHRNFFPLETLNMDNLPPLYRRDDIMKYLKLVAGLTVRVTVNYVSEERPETVPGTDIPYPWFSNRGSNLVRVGSGWVDSVVTRNDEDCPCKECQNSLKPRRQFACIEIKTVTHNVYDQLEAERTTCDLFFDSGETPDVCKDAVTLTEMYTFYKSTSNDECTIQYCTHDMDLNNMVARYVSDFISRQRHDDFKSTPSFKQNGGGNTELETPLSIVVSHPHGCAKHVIIGCYDIRGNDGTEDSQCFYGDITCPGSSGAPMFVLSQQLMYPMTKPLW